MIELVIERGGKELVSFPLTGNELRIGRAGTNDISLPEPTISRHQFRLEKADGGLVLLDTSGKGTIVNGKKIEKTDLRAGSQIKLGSLTATLREVSEPAAAGGPTAVGGVTQSLPVGTVEQQPLRLCGTCAGQPVEFPLRGRILNIGQDPTNDLVLKDSFVSSFHCRLFQKNQAWFIIDLDSTNGTRVNGVQVGEARLEPGATLTLGRTTLQVETPATAAGEIFEGLVSRDEAMKPVFEIIRRAAPTDETVLITGDSGTGKELVARACHRLSARSAQPLISLNCAAITKELMESELFGHEKGAFTGAQNLRRGMFEEADGGTLLLDEIGELMPDLQAKLLRALEAREIRRVGSNKAISVDVRVLAATHRSLPDLVREGRFREDLYFRICVIEIKLPPLRKRPQDIPLLARYFLEQATRHTQPKELSEEAIERLCAYGFPGNVRELKHIVTRAAILCPDRIIQPKHLTFAPPTLADRVAESRLYRKGKTLHDVEREAILQALDSCDGNQRAAARLLGIARSTMLQKMDKYGIATKL